MNLLQLLDRDLGVNLGLAQLGMTQQLLDEPDVGPAFEHQRGAGVPEQVATALLATGQSFSGSIRHSASRAALALQKKGFITALLPLLGGNLRENGDESGHSSYPEEVYSHKQ